ncbi:GNAT family N-acetyltransferase [Pseudarthrobacter sp. J75]|uniref:GNAT family N-acetyltransferase n=1 Tax=unclassified Pseudarthrobacter TaxID=2647000 RepID=UPI002E81D379|nr:MULTISPECIES: GNAT family N-acetyltransferase [unclassified Pseudarthrobacter]MEE2524255.1 GNAT family N-acetyltransferase [Pseudarthrobacter sp. J47]MEE2530149.1 GNAT family N-acetyltransferase [Pseudarthrobacter sp. J75]
MPAEAPPAVVLLPSTADDAGWLAELRAAVMRPDLERLERFDPTRVRQRFLDAFVPAHTWIISTGSGEPAGVIAVRPTSDELWIEHFYLASRFRGSGIGTAVLNLVLEKHAGNKPFRLNVLQGSPARRLYERHGFVLESEDSVDVFMVRHPASGKNETHD